jgi:myo-inositol-1(or 4)-monophosphatase
MAYISPALNVMMAAARKAGKPLIRDLGELENLQVSMKGPADFVTNADKRTEKILIDELTRVRPGYGFLAEESGAIEGADKTHRFIIDPIDGTTNFLHGIPHFAISIALEREGQIVTALVYNPVTDDMFMAEKGQGAFLNNKRLRVGARKTLNTALVATGIPFQGHGDFTRFDAELNAIMPNVAGIRRFGAASLDLAYVAAGRFDAFWERDLSPWDIAAGLLLVKEAQGMVSDLSNGTNMLDSGTILAANEMLHPQLLKMIKVAKA